MNILVDEEKSNMEDTKNGPNIRWWRIVLS